MNKRQSKKCKKKEQLFSRWPNCLFFSDICSYNELRKVTRSYHNFMVYKKKKREVIFNE